MKVEEVKEKGREIGYWRHFTQYLMPSGEMYLTLSDSVYGPFKTAEECIAHIEKHYSYGSWKSGGPK